MNSEQLVKRYRVENARKFRLRDYDPADTAGLRIDRKKARKVLARDIGRLSELQERLYAQDRWSILPSFRRWTRTARTAPSSTSCPVACRA